MTSKQANAILNPRGVAIVHRKGHVTVERRQNDGGGLWVEKKFKSLAGAVAYLQSRGEL